MSRKNIERMSQIQELQNLLRLSSQILTSVKQYEGFMKTTKVISIEEIRQNECTRRSLKSTILSKDHELSCALDEFLDKKFCLSLSMDEISRDQLYSLAYLASYDGRILNRLFQSPSKILRKLIKDEESTPLYLGIYLKEAFCQSKIFPAYKEGFRLFRSKFYHLEF